MYKSQIRKAYINGDLDLDEAISMLKNSYNMNYYEALGYLNT